MKNPDLGKAQMLQAVSQEVERPDAHGLHPTCEMGVGYLLIPNRDLKFNRLINRYARNEGMVIANLGYIGQAGEEMNTQ